MIEFGGLSSCGLVLSSVENQGLSGKN